MKNLAEKEPKLSATDKAIEALRTNINPNPVHNEETLSRLFNTNYTHVKDVASVPGLSIFDIDNIISRAAKQLTQYCGPDNGAAFCEWIGESITLATSRLLLFHQMKAEHGKVVLKAIWSVIEGCRDLGADFGDPSNGIKSPTVDEIETETWLRIFLNLDEWLEAGYAKVEGRKPAKISTRLYAFARLQAIGWRTDRVRKKHHPVGGQFEESLTMRERVGAGKPRLRPVVLGPGDEDAYRKAEEPDNLSASAA